MLKDLLFPRLCLSCGFLGGYICERCRKKLFTIKTNNCLYCGKSSLLGLTHPQCVEKDGIDGVISGFYYNPTAKKIIKAIKYRLVKEAIMGFLNLLEKDFYSNIKKIIKEKNNLFIQPIPLSEKRLKERGFNLADNICEHIGFLIKNKPSDFLINTGSSIPQAHVKEKEKRRTNVLGVFKARQTQLKTSIILVDDIITSGSTMKEAARVLKQNGAEEVFAASVVRG